ncbi:hypothetical protein D3C81_1619290 [compost metagenome]
MTILSFGVSSSVICGFVTSVVSGTVVSACCITGAVAGVDTASCCSNRFTSAKLAAGGVCTAGAGRVTGEVTLGTVVFLAASAARWICGLEATFGMPLRGNGASSTRVTGTVIFDATTGAATFNGCEGSVACGDF